MLNFNISDFFKKIGNIQGKEVFIRQVIQSCCKDVAGLDVNIEDISLKSGVVSINKLSSSARSVLFIKKQNILEKINMSQKERIVTNIR